MFALNQENVELHQRKSCSLSFYDEEEEMASTGKRVAILANAGAIRVDEPMVQDGNLITSRKPANLPQFNAAIIEALQG